MKKTPAFLMKKCKICPKEAKMKEGFCCSEHCTISMKMYVGESLVGYLQRKKDRAKRLAINNKI